MSNKYSIVCLSLLLGGCSTLSVDDGFDDAISEVSQKSNYTSITAKKITPEDVTVGGSNTLKNITYVVANYPKNDKKAPESFAKVQLSYFKNYDEFTHVAFNNHHYPIEAYKISSSTCTEHCSITQYFTFPIDNSVIKQSAKKDFIYTLKTENDSNQLSFSIPSGYFQAIENEHNMFSSMEERSTQAIYKELAKADSKPVEMSKYWFDEATVAEQDQFTEWAFANRKSISAPLMSDSKPLDMLSYWYEKASVEDKAQILTWLLNK